MFCVVTCFLFPVLGKFLSGGKYTLALALGLCYMFPVYNLMQRKIFQKMEVGRLEPPTAQMLACTLTPTPGGSCWQFL